MALLVDSAPVVHTLCPVYHIYEVPTFPAFGVNIFKTKLKPGGAFDNDILVAPSIKVKKLK